MALINVAFEGLDDVEFDIVIVKAGDAPEMITRLNNALVSPFSEESIVDLTLGCSGSGPTWEAGLVFGEPAVPLTPEVLPAQARFACVIAGNPPEVRLRLLQQLETIRLGMGLGVTLFVNKMIIAGSADGLLYMGLIICAIVPDPI
jgi:hypothetical protein